MELLDRIAAGTLDENFRKGSWRWDRRVSLTMTFTWEKKDEQAQGKKINKIINKKEYIKEKKMEKEKKERERTDTEVDIVFAVHRGC